MNDRRAGGPVLPARLSLCGAILAASAIMLPASPARAASAVEISQNFAEQSIAAFYGERGGAPIWLRDGSEAAQILMDYLRTAEADGLDPYKYHTEELAKAMGAAWGGSPSKVRKADMLLSQAFVSYVSDLKRAPDGIVWVDAELRPSAPSPAELLRAAADAPSLDAWLRDMRFMSPIYAGLRNAIAHGQGAIEAQQLRLNRERARALPTEGRYILVNAAAAELTMFEDGQPVDSMKVVVGKPKNPTPMMAALVRFASLNPYWYVPPDLAQERIAPNVLKEGLGYLKGHGYQVMGNWNDPSTEIDPATIDWQAVADGTKQVYIRQLPGPGNSMGQMKFMFPNNEGVYLHDTPQKELLSEASRLFSGGCVRLEDAPRLGRWLFGKPLDTSSRSPELRVDLPKPVPVYITYLTVMPTGHELATYPDVYGRDREQMVMAGGNMTAAH